MKKVIVRITEVLKRDIEVEVPEGVNLDQFAIDALERVYEDYRNEEIVLDSEDFTDREFAVFDENAEEYLITESEAERYI